MALQIVPTRPQPFFRPAPEAPQAHRLRVSLWPALAPFLLGLFCLGILTPGAQAAQKEYTPVQVIFLKYEDQKQLKALSKSVPLFRVGGEVAVMGEIALDGTEIKLNKPLPLYVPRLAKSPKISKVLAEAPYDFDKEGKREVIGKFKKNLVEIPAENLIVVFGDNGQRLKRTLISDFGLYSLCADLEQRREEVVELRSALKKIKQTKAPEEWENTRRKLVNRWEGLVEYVEDSLLFKVMAPKLRAEMEKGIADLRDQESDARVAEILAALADVEPTALELGSDADMDFFQIESKHIRLIYLTGKGGIDHEYAKELTELAEESIELFRQTAIDPFEVFSAQQASDKPIIPDLVFQEFFIGLDDTETHQELFEEHYKQSDTDIRSFETMATGMILQHDRSKPLFLSYAKNKPGSMPGFIVHQIGHAMAALQYNHNQPDNVYSALPVIQESVAMHLCFEKLGNNNMRCVSFEKSTYEKQEVSDERKQVKLWDSYRDRFYKLSLRAPTFSDCAIVPMNQLDELHMAKGWASLQYILDHDPVLGQQWLRDCHASVTKNGDGDRTGLDRNLWREATKERMKEKELPEGDPLLLYEELVKAVAEALLD